MNCKHKPAYLLTKEGVVKLPAQPNTGRGWGSKPNLSSACQLFP